METPLLATKLLVPPERQGIIPRPRLTARMQAALNCSLILVSAPAGFGKTTMLVQWARQRGKPNSTAWVSLDDGDNDPVRFWQYFIASLKTIGMGSGEPGPALMQFSRQHATETVMTSLINETALFAKDVAIILDDYHRISSETIHSGLAFLVEHMPPNMHVVVSTRADPPLPLARYRGRGTMLEIGIDDLRLTAEEASALLQGSQGAQPDKDDVTILNDRTEGWAAGLRLAALSLEHSRDAGSIVLGFSGSQRYVMDYLMEEVLSRQPDDVESFLLRTSVLERLSASLCDAVTEQGGSRGLLSKLEASFGGFLVPLDESREWYRYHHLFSDLLRHQAGTVLGAQNVNALHLRASCWYEQHDFTEDAVHHALASGDMQRAVRLVSAVAQTLNKRGERETLLAWLHQVPQELVRKDAMLYGHYAYALVTSDRLESAEQAIAYLESAAGGDNAMRGRVATLKAIIEARRGNVPLVAELAERALSLLPQDDHLHRSWASHAAGYVHCFCGFLNQAWPRLEEAYREAMESGNEQVAVSSLHWMAVITRQRGRLSEAKRMACAALDMARNTPAAAVVHPTLYHISYELNDLEAAIAHAGLAVKWSEFGASGEARLAGYWYQIQACLAQGDTVRIAEGVQKAEEIARDSSLSRFYKATHAVARAVLAVRRNDQESMAQRAKELEEYRDVLPLSFAHTPARVLIALGKKRESAEELRRLHLRAVDEKAEGLIVGIRVCQALAAPTQAEALGFLTDALVKGEPEGYIRTFVDEGKLLAPLLRRALLQGITPEYTARLLRTIAEEERRWRSRPGTATATQNAGILSGRELEIVRLMEAGLSNRQIADRLVVTLGTTKVHVYNIMQKLSARSRTQAIARARDLQLV